MVDSENFQRFKLNQRARPILKWAGGKSQLLPQLIPHFPKKFDRYVEPFLGAGAVFFSLAIDCPAVINDANPELYELYVVLRDKPEELIRKLGIYSKQYSEDFYYELRASRPRSSVGRAARCIFLNKTGFNGLYRVNSKGDFNVPFGKRDRCPALYDLENVLEVSKRLKNCKITNLDFSKVLRSAKKGDFIYCDPPYAPLSMTASFNSYTPMGFSQAEQVRLKIDCDAAIKKGAIVAISNSASPTILDLYQNWNIQLIKARRSINSKSHLRGPIHELLIGGRRSQSSLRPLLK